MLLLAVGSVTCFSASNPTLHAPQRVTHAPQRVTPRQTVSASADTASVYSEATALIQQLSSELSGVSEELNHAIARCDALESECRAQRERLARLATFEAALDAAQAPGQWLVAAGHVTDAALLWAMVASSSLRKQMLSSTGGPDLRPTERLLLATAVQRSRIVLAAHVAAERWREARVGERANATAHELAFYTRELADAAARAWSWVVVSAAALWQGWSAAALAALAACDGTSAETLRMRIATATAVRRARVRVAYVSWRQAAALLVEDELRPRVADGAARLRPALETATVRTAAAARRGGRLCRVLGWRARRGCGAPQASFDLAAAPSRVGGRRPLVGGAAALPRPAHRLTRRGDGGGGQGALLRRGDQRADAALNSSTSTRCCAARASSGAATSSDERLLWDGGGCGGEGS